MTAPDLARIDPADTALVVVDVQTKLAAAMAPDEMTAVERNIGVLVELARRQGWSVLWSEQYPQGLGPTLPALGASLGALGATPLPKLTFASTDDPAFNEAHARAARGTSVVVGMEAHVCVLQTVRGLRARGQRVFVPADAVISRTAANRNIGLDLIRATGALVSSTETVAFDALARAGSDDFRAISRLVK